MTNRRDEMYELDSYRNIIESELTNMFHHSAGLLDKLLDAEDIIEEQAKRIDLLETELDDAKALVADLERNVESNTWAR